MEKEISQPQHKYLFVYLWYPMYTPSVSTDQVTFIRAKQQTDDVQIAALNLDAHLDFSKNRHSP